VGSGALLSVLAAAVVCEGEGSALTAAATVDDWPNSCQSKVSTWHPFAAISLGVHNKPKSIRRENYEKRIERGRERWRAVINSSIQQKAIVL